MRVLPLFIAASVAFSALPALAETSAVQKLQTARALYDLGLAEGDGLMVLTAAKLRKSVVLAGPAEGAEGAGPITWEDMLASAAPLIEGDPTLEGIAEDIEAERAKGVTEGPVFNIGSIDAGGRNLYRDVPFDGGVYAEVYIEGPSGSDINLYIRDAQDRLVCSDSDISAIAYCGWRPVSDAGFTIVVEHANGPGGRYSLISN